MMTDNKWFGKCSICQLEKNLETVVANGDIKYSIKKACSHCVMTIQNDIDHSIRQLRVDSFEQRMKLKNSK